MAGKRRANGLQRLGSALHDIVAHGAVDMNVKVGRDQSGTRVGVACLTLLAANDGRDVPVVARDSGMLDEFVAAQEPPRRDCGHPLVPFSPTGKDIATEKCLEMSLAAREIPLGARSRTEATGANGQ